jgi:uncharacterized protein (DUF4415 family)
MPKLKPGTLLPTAAEDAAITAAAMADPDAVPLTDAEWAAVKPRLGRGRPPLPGAKQPVKLRLDPDLLAALRASGPGWQTRVNDLLRRSVLG